MYPYCLYESLTCLRYPLELETSVDDIGPDLRGL